MTWESLSDMDLVNCASAMWVIQVVSCYFLTPGASVIRGVILRLTAAAPATRPLESPPARNRPRQQRTLDEHPVGREQGELFRLAHGWELVLEIQRLVLQPIGVEGRPKNGSLSKSYARFDCLLIVGIDQHDPFPGILKAVDDALVVFL